MADFMAIPYWLGFKQFLPQILALFYSTKTSKQTTTDMRGIFSHLICITKGVLNGTKLHGVFLKGDK